MFVELNSTHKIVSLNSTFKALGVEFSFTIEVDNWDDDEQ